MASPIMIPPALAPDTMPPPVLLARGFDVSEYSGSQVNFQAFADDGFSFVFLRSSVSDHRVDKEFSNNVDRAKAAGLIIGTYHAFFTGIDPEKQARFYYQVCQDQGLGAGSDMIIPCSDFELLHQVPVSKSLDQAYEFQKALEAAWALEACNSLVYSYPAFIDLWPESNSKSALGLRKLAIAHYGVNKPRVPSPWSTWADWQHAGNVMSHGALVDLDCYNGPKESIPLVTRVTHVTDVTSKGT